MVNELISNEEMAQYMTNALGLKLLHDGYCQSGGSDYAHAIFREVGNLLAKYYISTGDNSMEGAEKIIQMYLDHEGTDEKTFLRDYYMPLVEEKVANELGLDDKDSLQARVQIHAFVAEKNANNRFYTHCFPGALYDEVSENGLDISKEMFKDEYAILSRCFKTAFQVGNLNYCELSSASLSYATMGMPERARYAIGSNIKPEPGENLHDACMRALQENLSKEIEKGTVTEEQAEFLRKAGARIVDFYCSAKSSCIAFFRDKSLQKDSRSTVENRVIRGFKGLKIDANNTFISRILQEVEMENQKNPGHEIENYQNVFAKIIDVVPEMKTFIDDTLAYCMGTFEINNYFHGGNADGYAIEGGKLASDKFSVATLMLPSEIVADFQMKNPNASRDKRRVGSSNDVVKDDIKQILKRMKDIESGFGDITDEMKCPDSIDRVIAQRQRIFIGIDEDKVYVPRYPCLGRTESGDMIYSKFCGNLDGRIIQERADSYPEERKKEIIEVYKLENKDFDEDFLEDDALEWQARKDFDSLPESEKERLRRETLIEAGRFVVSVRDGQAVVKMLDNDGTVQEEEYTGERLYDRDRVGKYDKLFRVVRDEKMPLANYHESIYECDYLQEMIQSICGENPEFSGIMDEQVKVANELYTQAMSLVKFERNGVHIKAGRKQELAKKIKANPVAMKILKALSDKEKLVAGETRKGSLSVAVKICESCDIDIDI